MFCAWFTLFADCSLSALGERGSNKYLSGSWKSPCPLVFSREEVELLKLQQPKRNARRKIEHERSGVWIRSLLVADVGVLVNMWR